ncbi:MAG: tRNA (N(6)-L-threonylcarbamoyladenosine(37)-C(2))-methylthiotransferase MtaB [Candidatus Eisenbacteria bacterium]
MRSVAFVTVGCKLNQFETEQMREAVEEMGHGTCPPTERADVYVINTCTVTSKSDYRSRQAIRRAVKVNPEATVVVTGCYAQLAPDAIAEIAGVDAVIGNAEKERIGDYVDLDKQTHPVIDVSDSGAQDRIDGHRRLHGFGKYTRAFVKIQDGCDNRCSYCAVPLARGRSRSKRWEDVAAEIDVLAGEGYKEIVLTGVHLGSYGRDLSPQDSLATLLRRIAAACGPERVRLSSIEPTDFSDELIDLMADPAMKICAHVHVPLQSGDDGVLERMGRPYDRRSYSTLIHCIADRVPLCGIGADVMVGFPGEDRDAFSNTRDLLMDLPVTYLHVFSFSPRYKTEASMMSGQVAPEEKKERSFILRRMGREKSLEFRKSLSGKTLDALVLGSTKSSYLTGLSGNYVKAFLTESAPVNEIVPCRVTGVRGEGVLADLTQ